MSRSPITLGSVHDRPGEHYEELNIFANCGQDNCSCEDKIISESSTDSSCHEDKLSGEFVWNASYSHSTLPKLTPGGSKAISRNK